MAERDDVALIERRTLGHSEVTVTRLGLGCAPLGNLYKEVSEEDAASTVAAALDAGINYFDVAPLYGLGLAERRLGSALRGISRDEYVISTKVGRLLVDKPGADAGIFDVPSGRDAIFDFSGDGVLRSLDSSLQRLGLDRIDVVFVHDPDEHEADALTGAVRALNDLRGQGVVGAIGVGMNQASMLERFVAAADLDVVLLAGRWTLLDQTGEALLDLCAARGVSVVIGGVFNSGLLAEPIEGATFDYLVAPDELVERARHLRTQAERSGTTLTALSLAFSGAHEAVTSILVGCRSASELTANVGAFESPPDAATLDVLSGLTWE